MVVEAINTPGLLILATENTERFFDGSTRGSGFGVAYAPSVTSIAPEVELVMFFGMGGVVEFFINLLMLVRRSAVGRVISRSSASLRRKVRFATGYLNFLVASSLKMIMSCCSTQRKGLYSVKLLFRDGNLMPASANS